MQLFPFLPLRVPGAGTSQLTAAPLQGFQPGAFLGTGSPNQQTLFEFYQGPRSLAGAEPSSQSPCRLNAVPPARHRTPRTAAETSDFALQAPDHLRVWLKL